MGCWFHQYLILCTRVKTKQSYSLMLSWCFSVKLRMNCSASWVFLARNSVSRPAKPMLSGAQIVFGMERGFFLFCFVAKSFVVMLVVH